MTTQKLEAMIKKSNNILSCCKSYTNKCLPIQFILRNLSEDQSKQIGFFITFIITYKFHAIFIFFLFHKENIVMTNLRLQAEQKEIQINITDANVVSLLQIVIKFFFLHLLIYCFPFHL